MLRWGKRGGKEKKSKKRQKKDGRNISHETFQSPTRLRVQGILLPLSEEGGGLKNTHSNPNPNPNPSPNTDPDPSLDTSPDPNADPDALHPAYLLCPPRL